MGLGALVFDSGFYHDYIFIGKRLPISSELDQIALVVIVLVVAPIPVVLEGKDPRANGDCDDREQAAVCREAHQHASFKLHCNALFKFILKFI